VSELKTELPPERSVGAGATIATWGALVGLSLGSYYLAEGGGAGPGWVLAPVLVKLWLVLAVFMELARHGRAWLLPIGGFLALVVGVLAVVLGS